MLLAATDHIGEYRRLFVLYGFVHPNVDQVTIFSENGGNPAGGEDRNGGPVQGDLLVHQEDNHDQNFW